MACRCLWQARGGFGREGRPRCGAVGWRGAGLRRLTGGKQGYLADRDRAAALSVFSCLGIVAELISRGFSMRSVLLIVLGFLLFCSADPARAEKRVALVIGVSAYQAVPQLPNPR